MRGTSAIVGVGESKFYRPGAAPETEFQLAIIAIKNAAADAGIELADIDGFVSYSIERNGPGRVASVIGARALRWAALAVGGGNCVASTLAIADAAVTAGYADFVLCYRSLAQGQFERYGQSGARATMRAEGDGAFQTPYGLSTPAEHYAMMTKRWMHEHGIGQDALMEISLAAYEHAQRNPRAVRYGRPITADDYRNSRWIVEPYRLFDCCQENDGAAAVIVTSAERARSLPKPPVYVRAAAIGIDYRGAAGGGGGWGYVDPDFPTAHFKTVADDLWSHAGVGPKDVQVAQFYENFTGMTLMAMCEMGVADPATVEDWMRAGNLRWPDGELPLNTSGGNLAEGYIHGLELLTEAARQVRGESTCQVKDVRYSLVVSGPGAIPASAALLSRDP